jgi:hypothetical protein
MQIRQVFVQGYKGTDAVVRWAPGLVLFGPNDAGKSNILEALAWVSGSDTRRGDPLTRDDDDGAVGFVVDLEGLDDDESLDSRLLAALLQTRHVPPLFPYRDPDAPQPDPVEEEEMWDIAANQFPASLLRWDPKFNLDWSFKLGCVGDWLSSDPPVRAIGSLTEARAALRREAMSYAEGSLDRLEARDAGARAAFELLLDRCLRMGRMLCYDRSEMLFVPPSTHECTTDEIAAAHCLAAAKATEDRRIPILDGFVQQLVVGEDEPGQSFLAIDHTHSFQPWDVIQVSGSSGRYDEVARDVETFIREGLRLKIDARGAVADQWLMQDEQGATTISDDVHELCERLSVRATEVAPEFVTRGYVIRVEPLDQVRWHGYSNRRIRLTLRRWDSDESFPLEAVASGLAIWATFAIEEATRHVRQELKAALDAAIAEIERKFSVNPDADSERTEPQLGQRSRLYIFDEPERHLHPRAQEQAARWLAGRLDDRTSVVLATHALPFLSLPSSDVEYILVLRGSDGVTRAESMSEDVWGVLDSRTSEAGIGSRAQLIQVARAFLIVEGAHDVEVLRHFFGDVLDRERIIVLPARGAQKAKSLIEAELLAMLDAPMIFLFDDIDAPSLIADTPPSGKDVAAHALWQMLHQWPSGRKPPHVVSFELPDIYCALPDECVQQIVKERKGSFPGWAAIVQAFTAEGPNIGFKRFFLTKSSLPAETDTDELLAEILERCRMKPRDELTRAMDEVLERTHASAGLA